MTYKAIDIHRSRSKVCKINCKQPPAYATRRARGKNNTL